MSAFKIHVLYSQFAVFEAGLESPLNIWTSRHVQQGFSWREKSVSFKTFRESGEFSVQVKVVDDFPQIDQDSDQVIDVPLMVGERGIEMGSVTSSVAVSVPEGEYQLRTEVIEETGQIRAWLKKTPIRYFQVLRLQGGKDIPSELLLETKPAL